MLNAIIHLNTDGTGIWGGREGSVGVTAIKFRIIDTSEGGRIGSLDVFFDPEQWNIDELGLIYTDKGFREELNEWLSAKLGTFVTEEDVDYSEQGMQARNLVNFDVSVKLANFVMENFSTEVWVDHSYLDFLVWENFVKLI